MSARPALVIAFLLAGVVLGLTLGAQRLAAAHTGYRAAIARFERTHADARRVLDLRALHQVAAENRPPEQDVIRRVGEALATAGIPEGRFAGLRPALDVALPASGAAGPEYRRQSVRVSLTGIRVSELGRFLSAWREAGSLWTPSRIDLTHAQEGRFDVSLLLSATYVADQ